MPARRSPYGKIIATCDVCGRYAGHRIGPGGRNASLLEGSWYCIDHLPPSASASEPAAPAPSSGPTGATADLFAGGR